MRSNEESITSRQADHDELRHVSEETPCPYLEGRHSRSEAYQVDVLDGLLYEQLLARGFRRSGRVVYRPRCRACCECRSIRIPTDLFLPSRSMRRIQRRNADVRVEVQAPVSTDEKFELFCRYLDAQHDETMVRDFDSYREFLYDSPIKTVEFEYRLGDRLIAVGLADQWSGGLSSVYAYFDPRMADRSLGTFSVLWEVDYCRRNGLPYYYLGYYVAESGKMAYKSRFRPNEVLVADNRWVMFRE